MNQPYPTPAAETMPAPKKRKPRKGMAVAALVLGVVALAGSPLPILNNATIVCGFIGVVFGVIGLFGRHRIMTISGLVLAVAGITIGLVLQAQWGRQLDQIGSPALPGVQAAASPSTTPPRTYHATPSTTYAPPPIEPGDFTIGLKTISKQCFGSAGCNVMVQPTVTYAGTAAKLTAYGKCDITYSISGDDSGDVIATAYGQGGTQFRVGQTMLSTKSSKVTPAAHVTDVNCQ